MCFLCPSATHFSFAFVAVFTTSPVVWDMDLRFMKQNNLLSFSKQCFINHSYSFLERLNKYVALKSYAQPIDCLFHSGTAGQQRRCVITHYFHCYRYSRRSELIMTRSVAYGFVQIFPPEKSHFIAIGFVFAAHLVPY